MASLSNNLISITGGTNNFNDESAHDYKGLLSKSKVEGSDVFMFSRKIVGNPLYDFSTNIITYEKLSAFIVNNIINYDKPIEIEKNWKFDGPESFINIDTNVIEENIKNPKLHDIAINVDFFEEKIVGQIYALSTEIYKNSHKPSLVGDIITSYTLSTITDVKNIYGDYTEWENISERSLIGFGKAEIGSNSNLKWGQISTEYDIYKDNQLGGNNFEQLTIRNIPKHSHKCKIDNCDINYDIRMSWIAGTNFDETKEATTWFSEPGIRWGIFGRPHEKNTGVQGIRWSFYFWNEIADTTDSKSTAYFINARCGMSGSYWNYDGTTYAWKSGTIGSLNANFDIICPLSTSKITGNGDNGLYKSIFDFNTGLEFAGSKLQEKAKSHNNLPPFVTKYIWKRTS